MRDLLDFLSGLGPVTGSSLRDDVQLRLAVERALSQLVVQAVDINGHVSSRSLARPPQTQRESFDLAARAGLIDGDLRDALMPSVGLRHMLVHEYGEIDLERVADAIPHAVQNYGRFVRSVARAITPGG